MNAAARELLVIPLRALRRSTFWWALGLAAMIALTMAFWPAFRDSRVIQQSLDLVPPALAKAFGIEDLVSPAGYLRGNLYAILVPLLLIFAAVLMTNGQTAAEEAAGRLELYLAEPVDRRWLLLGRGLAAAAGVGVISIAVLVTQVISDAIVNVQVDLGRLVATVILSGFLALLHGALAFAVAGWRARPSLVLGTGTVVAIAGYLVAMLFPLSDALAEWRHLSPWDWALGGNPLTSATEPWRYAALLGPTVLLWALGLRAFGRRDVAAA
jgi:ABC-2 type transport system permease protein